MNRQERRRDRKAGARQQDLLSEGFQLYQKGKLAAAQNLFRQALQNNPDQPDAIRLLAEVLLDLRQFDEAILRVTHLAKLQPAHFLSHYSLGTAYRLAGQPEPAVRAYRAALALNPDFVGALHGIGAALNLAERECEALAWLRRAVALQPDFAPAWQELAAALAIMGELSEAESAYQRAVALDPHLGNARRMLAAVRQDKPADDEIDALLVASNHPGTPPAARIDMLFAAGRLLDRTGDVDRAFDVFSQANFLRRASQAAAGIVYGRQKFSSDIDGIIAAFDQACFAAGSGGHPSEAPVFIVGMPRSGSSLFEQIAASHPDVTGAGEFPGIGEIARRLGPAPQTWTSADILAAAENYLDGLTAKAGAAERLIDKMPDNIFHVGLIAMMFPHARVIFCERDPADTCLSCFFQNFSAPLAYDTDLEDAAHRCAEITRLARHWRNVLPLRHMTLRYEEVVEDLPAKARELIAFLGLDWDDSCLAFHRTTRPVRTASWAQVRQPLYQDAVGKWRRYEHLLSKKELLF